MKPVIAATLAASLGASASWAGGPPIVNPGAPGAPSRTISAEESVALSRTEHTEADVRFMQHMIVHHAQAVEMGELIEARTDHRGVTLIGLRIALTQASEMDMMSRWLRERGEPVEDENLHHGHHHAHHGGHSSHAMHGEGHGAHAGHGDHGMHDGHGDHAMHADDHGAPDAPVDPREIPLMPGMLSPAQMDRLAAAEGAQFDRQFLEGMIVHHQGAIDMVESLLSVPGSGEDPQLSEFLSHVVSDQSAEILRMRNMLSELPDPAHDAHAHDAH